MNKFSKLMTLLFSLIFINNIYCANVEIDNKTLFKIKADLDIATYPDSQKEIGANQTVTENIGIFFLRGIKIGLHLGNEFFEDILEESLFQTLGMGDIKYNIFTSVEYLGAFLDQHVFEFTFYLIRDPRFLYSGGIVSTSKPIKVCTRDFKNFSSYDEKNISNQFVMSSIPSPQIYYNQLPMQGIKPTNIEATNANPTTHVSVGYGGTQNR